MASLVSVVVVGCSSADSGESTATSESPEAAPQRDEPVLEGTYRFDFDTPNRTELGSPSPGAQRQTARWVFRSDCRDGGCVATATKLAADGSAASTRTVLDFLDGKWVMVLGEDSKCNAGGQPARVLGTWVLEPQPDDILKGMSTEITTGPDCPWVVRTPITVTREGDVKDGIDVMDPTTVPARTPSAPEGFHGSYRQTVNEVPPSGEPGILTVDVQTFCVRNTDECASTQSTVIENDPQTTPLTYADGRWTYRWDRGRRTCPSGAPVQSTGYDELLLPDPAPNPMQALTGTRRLEVMPPCPGEQVFDLSYERMAASPPPPPTPGPPPPPTPAPVPAPAVPPGG